MKSADRFFVFVFVAAGFLPARAIAQQYTASDKGSKIEFTVHYHKDGDEAIRGRIGNIKGTVVFDPAHLQTASFDITAAPASVNTGLAERDKALKKPPFFATSLYPAIHIRSTSITTDRPGSIIYTLHGNLTIKGITKPVNIQFTAMPAGTGYLFRGGFHLSRGDYNIGDGNDVDKDVAVFIELKVVKK